jgi:hypothetical protein
VLRSLFYLLAAVFVLAGLSPAAAIESVRVPLDASALDLTQAVESQSHIHN